MAPPAGRAVASWGLVALLATLLAGPPSVAAATTSFDLYVTYPCYARVQFGGDWRHVSCPGTYGEETPLQLAAVTRISMTFLPLDEPFEVLGVEPEGYGRERGVWWELLVERPGNNFFVGDVDDIPEGTMHFVTLTFGAPETGTFTFRFWPFEEAVADWNLLVRITIETQG